MLREDDIIQFKNPSE